MLARLDCPLSEHVDTSAILGHCRQAQRLAASIKCRMWSASDIETVDRKQGTLWNLRKWTYHRGYLTKWKESYSKVLCESQIHLTFAHP